MRTKIVQHLPPTAIQAMLSLENYVNETAVSSIHKELIRLRASQLNGCAFCLDLHIREARAAGETDYRIQMVPVWRESSLYDEEEKLILQLTEELTLLNQYSLSAKTALQAKKTFTEDYLEAIIMTIVTINAWNRIALATNLAGK